MYWPKRLPDKVGCNHLFGWRQSRDCLSLLSYLEREYPTMHARKRQGFTLITLLVVIAIIAILLGVLLPAIMTMRMAASRVSSVNNIKQIMLALHNYHAVNGSFPAGVNETGYSAFVRLLPFVEQNNLLNQFDLTKPLTETP